MFIYIYECIVLMKFSIFSLHLCSSQAIGLWGNIFHHDSWLNFSLYRENIASWERILITIELSGCIIFPDYKI